MNELQLTVTTPDGPMHAFQALPDQGGLRPAVVVLQEAFGVNAYLREVCRRLARAGYVALAPELYHRSGNGQTAPYDHVRQALGHLAHLTNAAVERDLRSCLEHLRSRPGVHPAKVAVLGFCMGGFGAFLAACRLDPALAISFYPGGLVHERPRLRLTPLLDEAPNLRAPWLGLFGGQDKSIPPQDVEAVRKRLQPLGKPHEIYVYPDAGHGFHCDQRKDYHPESAAAAWNRALEWLARLDPEARSS